MPPCIALLASVAWFAAAVLPLTEAQSTEACQASTDEALRRLQVAPEAIREISIIPRREAHRSGWVIKGYDAWVRLGSCDGVLILDFSRRCRERQIHTRGDCRLAGLKAY